MQFLTKIDKSLAKGEEILLALLLVGLVVLAALQVLLRNVWNTSLDWGVEVLKNATVLIGLLGAAVATSEGRHLNIDLLGRAVKGRWKLLLSVVIGAFAVTICFMLTRGGWETYQLNYEGWIRNQLPPGWTALQLLKQELSEGKFPQWLSQVILPYGFALIGAHFLLRLIRDLGSFFTGVPWEGGEQEEVDPDKVLDEMEAQAGDAQGGVAKEPEEAATRIDPGASVRAAVGEIAEMTGAAAEAEKEAQEVAKVRAAEAALEERLAATEKKEEPEESDTVFDPEAQAKAEAAAKAAAAKAESAEEAGAAEEEASAAEEEDEPGGEPADDDEKGGAR